MRTMKRCISLFLAFIFSLGMFLPSAVPAEAAVSTNYTLTGDGADDIVAVALAQKGKTRSDFGYTEDWCAYFTCWAGRTAGAGFPSSNLGTPFDVARWFVNNNKGKFYCFRDGNYNSLMDSGITNTGNIVRTSRESFTPQKGDLICYLWEADVGYYNWSHIGIVTADYTGNGLVETVEGNTGGGTGVVDTFNRYYDSRVVGFVRPNYTKKYSASISVSDSQVGLDLVSKPTQTLFITASGNLPPKASFVAKSSDTSIVSTGWGDYTGGTTAPVILTAHKPGTTDVVCSVINADTNKTLATATVRVTVSVSQYTIIYNANGGTGAPASQTKTHGTALTLSSTIPTRVGYNFTGWATSASATAATYQPGDSYNTNSTLTLYAVWKQNTLATTTRTTASATIAYPGVGVYYKFTPSITTSYQFAGTDTVDNRIALYSSSGVLLASDDDSGDGTQFLLTAELTAGQPYYVYVDFYSGTKTGTLSFNLARGYLVTYNANGGSNAPAATYKYSGYSLYLSSTEPSRAGYTFQGWATSASAANATYLPGGIFNTNAETTLYAVWKPNQTYTISYDANGGVGAPASQTKAHGMDLILSNTVPTRTGYTFVCWCTSTGGASSRYEPGSIWTGETDITLYAIWQANEYTLTYNANGGSGAPSSQTKTHGTALTLSSTRPTRSGYTFLGWSTSASAASATYQPGSSFTTNANTTLYAVWKQNSSTHTAQIVVSSATAEAGKRITLTLSLKTNPGISGLAISLDFDEQVFTLKEVQNGTLFGAFTSGKNYIWDESENVTEDGVLATFVFEISADAEPGQFSIGVIPRSCVNSELESVELSPTNGTITITDIVYGDANGDGKVDMKDVVLLRKYMANNDYDTESSTVTVSAGADANGDGKVDMKDVVLLRKYMANYDYDTGSSSVILGPK